jgi:hypothetical protein
MFVGAYWRARKESQEAAAERIVQFLSSIAGRYDFLATWFMKARSRDLALATPISLDTATVADRLQVSRRDVGGEVISEIGCGIELWNGSGVSFSAYVGSTSPYVGNSVVLSFTEMPEGLLESDWTRLLELMILAFDPENAVVTSDAILERTGADEPWDAGLWSYKRGESVRKHSLE